jgi:hypothetical protein
VRSTEEKRVYGETRSGATHGFGAYHRAGKRRQR